MQFNVSVAETYAFLAAVARRLDPSGASWWWSYLDFLSPL